VAVVRRVRDVDELEQILPVRNGFDVDDSVLLSHLRIVDAGRLFHLVVGEKVVSDGRTVVPLVRPRPVAFDGQFGDQIGNLLRREVEEPVWVVVAALAPLSLGALVRDLFETLQLAGEDPAVAGVVADGGLTPRRLRPLVGFRTGNVPPFPLAYGIQDVRTVGSWTVRRTRSTCRSVYLSTRPGSLPSGIVHSMSFEWIKHRHSTDIAR
jgi:hypothetical protein